ncbi:MAG: MBL fold metallo-hydrolase [Chitinivibrionales bacterium]|nr:MBL fold metallo-hydrolase [Chitinivibrionales bacterium]
MVRVNIKILFDNYSGNERLRIGWGVSFLIDETILFDTGENGDWLLHNMDLLNVDISKLAAVVISHDHWDHTGGLATLLANKNGLLVYGCEGFSPEFCAMVQHAGGKLMEYRHSIEIAPHIYVSGEITGEYKQAPISEQALIVEENNDITIITGCAHAGICRVVGRIQEEFPGREIRLLMGGFHLMTEQIADIHKIAHDLRLLGIQNVGPTHCSGEAAIDIFKTIFGKHCIAIQTGLMLDTHRLPA